VSGYRAFMNRAELATLVRGAATPASADHATLVRLAWTCWPGGEDRTIPPARAWLRSWGPVPMSAPEAPCTCHAGRCPVCN
jgi:hypothetical protein